YADETMADADIRALVERMMNDEVTPLLPPVPGIDLTQYRRTLIERFGNPVLRDQLARIGTEGSARIPKFVLPSILDRVSRGGPRGRSRHLRREGAPRRRGGGAGRERGLAARGATASSPLVRAIARSMVGGDPRGGRGAPAGPSGAPRRRPRRRPLRPDARSHLARRQGSAPAPGHSLERRALRRGMRRARRE